MVGAARPTDATANNAIIVLRNIAILRQRYRSQPRHESQVAIAPEKRYGFDITVTQLCARD
jgi:hypothetical protein